MQGPDVFCERCGARQPAERHETASSGATFARRLRSAVTGTTADGVRPPTNSIFLRLCLGCRGFSCPACWNDEAGVCQTCAPLPEPVVVPEPVIVHEPVVVREPVDAPAPQPVFAPPEPVVVAFEPVVATPPAPVVAPPAPRPATPEPIIARPVVVEPVVPEPAPVPHISPRPIALPVPAPAPVPVARPEPAPRPDPVPAPSDPVVPAPMILPRPLPAIPFEQPYAASAPPVPMAAAPTPIHAAQPYHLPLPVLASQQQTPSGVRPCRNCQLAVSARAHFCRRCGTAQLAS